MMIVPAGMKVHLALGYTDMDGLAALVQEQPFSGHLFAFRGKRASILKVLFWEGNGLCLFTKRIDRAGRESSWSPTRTKVESGMRLDLDNLPSDMALLHGLLRDMAAVVEHRDGEIERLQTIIKQLQRAQFGRRSERLDPDQLALALEDLDSDIGRAEASGPHVDVEIADKRPRRKPLADHLPREEVVIDVANDVCPCCGGVLHSIGESVSQMLDWVPAQLRVLRITRPKYACRT
jgi:transposase